MREIISHLKFAFEITVETTQRIEIPEYPLGAIREMLVNSLCHRDYTNNTDVQIKIFDNYITFFNPGKLFGGLTVEDLSTDDYQSQARNKLIAEALYLTNDIEKYGSGYWRIRNYIANYPTMEFTFKETSGGFLTKLSYTEQKTTVVSKVTDEVTDELNVTQLAIVDLIKQNPRISTAKMSESIGISKRKILSNIAKLKRKNIVKRMGNNKSGYWKIEIPDKK